MSYTCQHGKQFPNLRSGRVWFGVVSHYAGDTRVRWYEKRHVSDYFGLSAWCYCTPRESMARNAYGASPTIGETLTSWMPHNYAVIMPRRRITQGKEN